MADDVTTTEIKPYTAPKDFAVPDDQIDLRPGAVAYVDEPLPAAERLRAFENEHFGVYAVRINDRIERGSGSPFADAAPEIREQHARIEKLIATEQKFSDAHAALIAADAEHETALEAVENADAAGE